MSHNEQRNDYYHGSMIPHTQGRPRAVDTLDPRILLISEPHGTSKSTGLNDETFKMITGETRLKIRTHYKKEANPVINKSTLFVCTNHMPEIRDHSVASRIVQLKFVSSFFSHEEDPGYDPKDKNHHVSTKSIDQVYEEIEPFFPEIMSYLCLLATELVKGYGSVRNAFAEVSNVTGIQSLSFVDSLAIFAEQHCKEDHRGRLTASKLFAMYQEFCDQEDLMCTILNVRDFGKRFRRYHEPGIRAKGKDYYQLKIE